MAADGGAMGSGIVVCAAPLPVKNRLRVLRVERDWSQGDLAERLGVSRQTVHAIESGKYDPSLPLAFRISRLFGQRIEELFDPDAQEEAPSDRR
jgi:putative transcriptional regulator